MEYPILIFLHLFGGIIWAGAAVAAGLFIIPAVAEAGPAGGAVMAGVARRRFPLIMSVLGVIVVLTGVRLYMMRFSTEWLVTPPGLVLTLGGILGLGGLAIGLFVQRPLVQRIGALAAAAASGKPPSEAHAAEMLALRTRLQRVARLTALHLLGASLLMSMHRLAAAAL